VNLRENEGYNMLIKAIVAIDNEKDCEALLDDLMTRKELLDIAQRLLVAKLLSEEVVYNKIVEETGASTATISRVNRSYQYGSGGYAKILKEIGDKI
jgi:TrpR-related protein YerC/YecD